MNSVLPQEESIILHGPAGKLEAKVFGFFDVANLSSDSPKTIGIVCHPHPLYQGTMDNKVVTTIIRAFQNLGLATIRFNFRGVGKSEGSYGEGLGEIEDLKAVIEWARHRHPRANIHLAGFSFGSYISVKVAVDFAKIYSITALLSVAPAIRLFDFLKLSQPSCPWVIIQGNQDELVAMEEVKSWFKNLQEQCTLVLPSSAMELIILPGASHFFHGRLIELKNLIIEKMKDYQRLTDS
jgi:alpha/beta superfamily hydrolase